MSFEIGDRVRVLSGLNEGKMYNSVIYRAKEMKPGHEGTVIYADNRGHYQISGSNVIYSEEMLEACSNREIAITIYRDGLKTVAKSILSGETATARCNPCDKYDFEFGARLAFYRLMHKHYNGKVVCVGTTYGNEQFRTGHVYDVINGTLYDGEGRAVNPGKPFNSANEVDSYLTGTDFIELYQ